MEPEAPINYFGSNNEQPVQPQQPPQPEPDKITEVYAPSETEQAITEPVADTDSVEPEADDKETVYWAAPEYIQKEKGGAWFFVLILAALAFIAVDILFLKSYTFSILVAVMAIAVFVLLRRPPREINYTLSGQQGLFVGEKLYHFSEFKAFGLINDDGNHCIMLIPVKRFSLSISAYFPDEVGEKIVDILGLRLPMEDLKLDLLDKIVRKLKF